MFSRFLNKSFFALAALATFATGCASSPDDEDAIRSSATEMAMDVVVQEVLAPTNGDRVDWKMISVPAPGTLKMELVIVDKDSIFGIEFKIYDRFGIPVKKQDISVSETTSQKFLTLTALLPEGGLHFVKIEAESGETDYTLVAKDFEPSTGFDIPVTEAPTFVLDSEINGTAGDIESVSNGSSGSAKSGKSGKSSKKYDDDDEDKPKKASKPKNDDAGGKIKPIVADLKGNFEKIEGKITNITPKGDGSLIRINLGSGNGVREGSVGEIYDGSGNLIKGARFKVDKISGNASQCLTNATPEDLEGAKKVVVKSPN